MKSAVYFCYEYGHISFCHSLFLHGKRVQNENSLRYSVVWKLVKISFTASEDLWNIYLVPNETTLASSFQLLLSDMQYLYSYLDSILIKGRRIECLAKFHQANVMVCKCYVPSLRSWLLPSPSSFLPYLYLNPKSINKWKSIQFEEKRTFEMMLHTKDEHFMVNVISSFPAWKTFVS